MILSMKIWEHSPKPSLRRYQSVSDYLRHGPIIYMSDSERRDKHWAGYMDVVKDLLNDPRTAPWLNGPFDLDWSKSRYHRLRKRDGKDGNETKWISNVKRILDNVVVVGIILFWISHITSALGFLLLTNTSGHSGHPMTKK